MSRTPALLLVAALAVASPGGGARAEEMVTLVADDYCPFNCEPGSERPGYAVELASRVFEARGLKVDYRRVSWYTAVAEVKAGRWNAVIGADEVEGAGFVMPATPLWSVRHVFVVRADDAWRYRGPASLAGRRLGLVGGYDYGEVVEAWRKANPGLVVRVGGEDPLRDNVKNLLDGKIDAFLEEASVLGFRSVQLELGGKLRSAGTPGTGTPTFLAFSPAHPRSKELARYFDEGVARLRASGELAVLQARYGLKEE